MRFEISRALNYLLPRKKHLSASIISLLSVLVISLVVWLVVVFLSVTNGIEKKWQEELVALNAPLRITPKEAYYSSYYYLIDQLSEGSNYTSKTLKEKLLAQKSDPYDPEYDAELPSTFPQKEQIDLVKEAWEAIDSLPPHFKLKASEYEITFGNLEINLLREDEVTGEIQKGFVSQVSYVAPFNKENERLQKLLLEPTEEDRKNSNKQLDGEGIYLSKGYQRNGVLIGDQGTVSTYIPSPSRPQEMKIPVYVAGFYDPGLMPLGNKMLFASDRLLEMLRTDFTISDKMLGNGFHLWLPNLKDVDSVKEKLQQRFDEKGLTPYFEIESFKDYEFSKPLLEQLQSDKSLFSLIAIIILLVACSNIISMLILLVNDKKKEIGILQSLGVSRFRVGLIFGLCGCLTGIVSSTVGVIAAIFTLKNLQSLVNFLSFLQGRDAFQSTFYGTILPNDLSGEALLFTLGATTLLSLIAGVVPAIKASRVEPAEILRKE